MRPLPTAAFARLSCQGSPSVKGGSLSAGTPSSVIASRRRGSPRLLSPATDVACAADTTAPPARARWFRPSRRANLKRPPGWSSQRSQGEGPDSPARGRAKATSVSPAGAPASHGRRRRSRHIGGPARDSWSGSRCRLRVGGRSRARRQSSRRRRASRAEPGAIPTS